MEAIRQHRREPTLEDRQRALRALHELQNLFKDDEELKSMMEENIVREIKEIRKELYDARTD